MSLSVTTNHLSKCNTSFFLLVIISGISISLKNTFWPAVTAVVRLLWRWNCVRYKLFRGPEQPQQQDQYSVEEYFMVGTYMRCATAVPVW